MSSTGFLGQIRKASNNKTARTVKELANRYQKLYTQNVDIEDESLVDQGRASKGRVVLDNKLQYTRKITTIPTFQVPEEPDNEFLRFWIKANHTGIRLRDLSLFDNEIIVNDNKRPEHLCLVDAGGGLDTGYLGTYGGVASCPCWYLKGLLDSAQVTDANRLCVSSATVGISLTAWVKVADFSQSQGTNRRIMAKKDDADNAYALFVTPTNKAVFAVKFGATEYRVEISGLVADTWYLISGTFDSSTLTAKIYLNDTVSTTPFAGSVTYPFVNTNLHLFTNNYDYHIGDYGAFNGWVRDIRMWKEKVLTQQEITNFYTNKNTISNIPLGSVMIAGFVVVPGDMELSSFTSQSFSSQSFNL